MAPVAREEEPANIALAERMEGLIERQHTLLIAAQENQHRADQHRLVLHDPDITEYPINSNVLYTPPTGRDNKLIPKHKGPYQVRGSFNGQANKDSYTQLASLHIRSCLHQSNQYCPTELTTVCSGTNSRSSWRSSSKIHYGILVQWTGYAEDSKQIKTHIHNLRPFTFDPVYTNPTSIAQQN